MSRLLLGLCLLLNVAFAQPPQVFTFSAPELEDLDPHVEIGGTAIREIFEGLVARDPKTVEPVPAVAQKWTRSADGKQWTFTLRGDAKWSNGDPVTAEDFVYSWARLLAPATGAINAYYAYHIRNARAFNRGEIKDPKQLGVKAVSPNTLTVELESPIPYFLELLDTVAFRPVHRASIEKFQGRWTRPGNIVSNGPFVLHQWAFGKVVTLKPNPHYWDRKNVKLTEVNILSSSSIKTNENLFRSKKVDLVSQLHQNGLESWRKDPAFRTEPMLNVSFLVLNMKKSPLDDKRVRTALSLGIDRKTLVEKVMRGNEEPAGSFVPPMKSYRPVSKIPVDASGAARGKALLAEAGYGPEKKFPELTLLFYKNENVKDICEAIQEMWRINLGIQIKLLAVEKKVFVNMLRTKDFDIGYSGLSSDYADPGFFLEIWIAGGGNNDAGFVSEKYDRLLKQADAEPTAEKREALFQKAEEILLDEMPGIPGRFGRRNYLLNPKVRGWYPNALGVHPLKNVSIQD